MTQRRPATTLPTIALILGGTLTLGGCGGKAAPATGSGGAGAGGGDTRATDDRMAQSTAMANESDPFGPLDYGADWQSYHKMNKGPVKSRSHGGRFVDTYVNEVGFAAYQDEEAPIPEGTVIVKTSWEAESGQPTTVAGPIFVMVKRAAGFAPDHDDWWYGFQWQDPPEKWAKKLGGPTYWRTPSKKVDYCWDCHENYDRALGMVPEAQRAW